MPAEIIETIVIDPTLLGEVEIKELGPDDLSLFRVVLRTDEGEQENYVIGTSFADVVGTYEFEADRITFVREVATNVVFSPHALETLKEGGPARK